VKFSAQRRPRRNENVVPLINVVFLLLIFFMLTSTLRPPEATSIELPTTASADATRPDRNLPVLVLDSTGGIVWGDRMLSQTEVRKLSAAGGLEIRADRDVPARVFLPLLEQLNEAGVPDIELVTRRVR